MCQRPAMGARRRPSRSARLPLLFVTRDPDDCSRQRQWVFLTHGGIRLVQRSDGQARLSSFQVTYQSVLLAPPAQLHAAHAPSGISSAVTGKAHA